MSNSRITFSALVGVIAVALASGPVAAQQRGAPAPPPGPTLEQSMSALDAARGAADTAGIKLSCAVVDSRGDLIALFQDGRRTVLHHRCCPRQGRALGDVRTAERQPGQPRLEPGLRELRRGGQTPLYPFQGALPITRDGETIGAMGCSGASSQQDEDAVRAALDRF